MVQELGWHQIDQKEQVKKWLMHTYMRTYNVRHRNHGIAWFKTKHKQQAHDPIVENQ
jgi:hypothetical protein